MAEKAKSRWPVHLEPKIPVMDKKLIITVCPQGNLIRREQNPNMPYTPPEVAKQAISAYKEGAAEAHFHAADADGYVLSSWEPYAETIELIRKEAPDMIMCPSISVAPKGGGVGLYEVATAQPMVDALLAKGPDYIEETIVTPVSYVSPRPLRPEEKEAPSTLVTEEKLKAETLFLQSKGIKPNFMCHTIEGIDNVREWLIEPGLLEKPYLICMGPGMHKPSVRTYPDPWGMVYLITMMGYLPRVDGVVTGASIGGRNWLPLTVLAIMLGFDYIRVGMEDTLHVYPHKDEVIQSSAQVTRKIANIARELGREIATPDEARKIFGLKTQRR